MAMINQQEGIMEHEFDARGYALVVSSVGGVVIGVYRSRALAIRRGEDVIRQDFHNAGADRIGQQCARWRILGRVVLDGDEWITLQEVAII